MSAYKGSIQAGLNEYLLYGGLPQILSCTTEEQKVRIFEISVEETYVKDIKDRYDIRKNDDLKTYQHYGVWYRSFDKSQ